MLRVASVPSGHVYVRHLADPDGDDGVVRLADPPPANPAPGAPWWPAVMLDPAWIDAHADAFDVAHLHFGFDHLGVDELRAVTDAFRRNRRPLVYTVHDLRNPHQPDRALHDAALDVLVPAADALITLTEGAAAEIERRWGRSAAVLPHPHIVPLDRLDAPRPPRSRPLVGVHLKSLRANMDPVPLVDALVDLAPARGIDLRLDVHRDIVTPGLPRHDPTIARWLDELASRGLAEVHVHDYFTDDELYDYLAGLDASALPYRFGTHSGWLEACFDLGTRVFAPDTGYYRDQHPGVLGYRRARDGAVDRDGLARALDEVAARIPWRATLAERLDERRRVAAAHRRLYDAVLAGGAA